MVTPPADPTLARCRKLGWRVAGQDGRLELVTGTVVDALEVPRAAGMLACRWWLYTDGVPDEIRGLPSMPPPGEAMVVIAAGDRIFFLTQAGACPWTVEDPLVTSISGAVSQPKIRWHSGGSRIPFPPGLTGGGHVPFPPGPTGGGHEVAWSHLPPRDIRLACPVVLLHLLATAVAAFGQGPHMLTLPGNALAIPVLGETGSTPPEHPPPPVLTPRPAVPIGFRT